MWWSVHTCQSECAAARTCAEGLAPCYTATIYTACGENSAHACRKTVYMKRLALASGSRIMAHMHAHCSCIKLELGRVSKTPDCESVTLDGRLREPAVPRARMHSPSVVPDLKRSENSPC